MKLPYELERVIAVAKAFKHARASLQRERWSRDRLLSFQRQRFAELVAYASRHSPFYRRLYGGAVDPAVRVEELPTTDKSALMEHFDELVTDRRVRLAELHRHLETVRGDEFYLDDLRVMASSGSTGKRAVYVYNRSEWSVVMAGMLRCSKMVGLAPRFPRVRVANIGAPDGKHMTFRTTTTLDVGLHNTVRAAATLPMERLVSVLNAHQPEFLSAYPSVAAMLATEQLEGRLRITPRTIVTSSELRTSEMTERIRRAFGVEPYDVYALTETGLAAAECEAHQGLHLFEDTCLYEVVDEQGRAVAPGVPGARVLVTNLFNRTQPMIRFEVTDLVTLDHDPCRCGRTTLRIKALEGRSDDVLTFPGTNGHAVAVHPIHLRSPLASIPAVHDYQITQFPDRLVIAVVLSRGANGDAKTRIERSLRAKLASLGVGDVRIDVEQTAALTREGAGKLKLVRRVTSMAS